MNQFRKNNKKRFIDKLSTIYFRLRFNKRFRGVFFEFPVHLMRYKEHIKLAEGVYIKAGARICPCRSDSVISIGHNTTIGYNSSIFSSDEIQIGSDCMIAPNVYMVDSDHGTDISHKMNSQDNISKPIFIGNDVWVGTGSVILKGAYIPDGCVIAANSVVKGILEPYCIYGGAPAKKIGTR